MKTFPKIKETASLPTGKTAESKAALNFMHAVYAIVRRIPKGRATSYGAIAEASGLRLTARMVGWAMNAAGRAKPPVPAHRVVNSKGVLSGRSFFATPTLMQELLEQEGITVKNDKIEDWARVFWDPAGNTGAKKTLPKKSAAKTTAGKSRKAAPAAGAKAPPAAKKSKVAVKKQPAVKAATRPGRKKEQ